MFRPDDPLAPPAPAFDAPWQAQALAIADAMVRAGHFTAAAWADTLGAELSRAETAGARDTVETYYAAVLSALEALSQSVAGIAETDRTARRAAWEAAYLSTPHGQPVEL